MSGIGPLWFPPAPGQPLTLDVNQTALDAYLGPEHPKYSYQVWIAINSGTSRDKTPFLQTQAER